MRAWKWRNKWFTGRVLVYLMILSMVFSCFSVPVLATEDPAAGSTQTETVAEESGPEIEVVIETADGSGDAQAEEDLTEEVPQEETTPAEEGTEEEALPEEETTEEVRPEEGTEEEILPEEELTEEVLAEEEAEIVSEEAMNAPAEDWWLEIFDQARPGIGMRERTITVDLAGESNIKFLSAMAFYQGTGQETPTVTWKSGDESIATVTSGGRVIFGKTGEVTVTAETVMFEGDSTRPELHLSAEAHFRVIRTPSGFSLDKEIELKKDETKTLVAKILPEDANVYATRWYCSNAEVLSLIPGSDGTSAEIKGLYPGVARVTVEVFPFEKVAESDNNYNYQTISPVAVKTCLVRVMGGEYTINFAKGAPDKDVTGEMKPITVKQGDTYRLPATGYKRAGYGIDGWRLTNPELDPPVMLAPAESGNSYDIDLTGGASDIQNVTLTAQWKAIQYRIRYVLNGASGYGLPDTYTIETATEIPDTYAYGFIFRGWYGDAAFTESGNSIPKGSTGEKTFYAKMEPIPFTIRFERNTPDGAKPGGADLKDITDAYVGMPLPAAPYTAKGCVFAGWAYESDATEPVYKAGEPADVGMFDYASRQGNKTVTLYAVWRKTGDKLRVYYRDPQGKPISDIPPDEFEYGKGLSKLPGMLTLRKGYIFDGWYTAKPGYNIAENHVIYDKKVTSIGKNQAEDVYLYAKISRLKFKFEFGKTREKGDTLLGKKPAVPKQLWDDSWLLPSSLSGRANRAFVGWDLNGDGIKDYDAGAEISREALAKYANGTKITLNAVWGEKQPYTVTFDLNGGETRLTHGLYFTYTYGEVENFNSTLSAFKPERDGYIFKGWFTETEGRPTGKAVTKLTNTTYGDKQLIAKWQQEKSLVIVYHDGDREISSGKQTLVSGKTVTLKKNIFKKDGAVLLGWHTDKSAAENGLALEGYTNGAKIIDPETNTEGQLHLYAVWGNQFRVRFHGSGEGGAADLRNGEQLPDPIDYTYRVTTSQTFAPAEKEGYVFKGWYTAETDAEGNVVKFLKKVTGISKSTAGDLELYPNYASKNVIVVFENNPPAGTGVKAAVKKQNIGFGKAAKLAKNRFKVKGYTFAGWKIADEDFATGVAVDFDNASLFDPAELKTMTGRTKVYSEYETAGEKATVTLQAQWKPNTYGIKYVHKDVVQSGKRTKLVKTPQAVVDTITVGSNTYTYSQETKTVLIYPERVGFSCRLYTDSACKKEITEIPAGKTGNLTLYVKWERMTASTP